MSDGGKEKTDKNGAPYWVHRLNGVNGNGKHATTAPRPPSKNQVRRADPDTLHRWYSALLLMLRLSDEHRDNLRKRGLSDATIDANEYRTLPEREGIKLAKKLAAKFPNDPIHRIPGLRFKENDRGAFWFVGGRPGLLIPVRDVEGRIVALKIRLDKDGDGGKYRYLTSMPNGPGPGSPIHVPYGVKGPIETCRLTEGPLKGDIAFALSGLPTIAAPGVSNWKPAVKALKKLGVKIVRVAFDSDAWKKKEVASAMINAVAGFEKAGFTVQLEHWDEAYKGIDDLLAAGKQPEVLEGQAMQLPMEAIVAVAGANGSGGKKSGARKDKEPSQATEMVQLVAGAASLFHNSDQETFASIPGDAGNRTLPVRSKAFRQWAARQYFEVHETAIGGEALASAINVLEGEALFCGSEETVYTRIAPFGNDIILDLAGEDDRAVIVTTKGWSIGASPVKFRRPRGILPIPAPERHGDINLLRKLINVGTDFVWRLIVGFLVGSLRPFGPYPILIFTGEQASAKSTACRLVKSTIDPNSAPLRSEPREVRDLMIQAKYSWILGFENLSHIPAWLSDAFCRLSTGGGFATRELYSNDDEILLNAQRPSIFNSIEDVATRADLLDRGIVVHLPRIRDEDRRLESELFAEFDAARPAILGGLLDAVVIGLRNLPHTKLDRLPRMADFAQWVEACGPGLGWKPGEFMAAYTANIGDANELALDASPLAAPLRELAAESGEWTGTATELLAEMTQRIGETAARSRDWPKKPNALTGRLRRLAPNLRKVGVEIDIGRTKKGSTVAIRRLTGPVVPADTIPADNPTNQSSTVDASQDQEWGEV